MANFSLNYGTLLLADSPNGIAIEDINYQVSKSIQEFELPKADGAVIPVARRKDLVVKMKGTLVGSSYTAARTNLDNLMSVLESSSEQKLTVDDERYLMVQYRNFAYGYRSKNNFIDFSFDVVASFPFWLSNTLTNANQTWTTGVGFNVSNGGTAPARLKITITAPGLSIADDIKLQNQTTGEIFQYRGTLAATKILVVNNRVDVADLAVTNDGADDIKNFFGDFLTLAVGTNTFVFTCSKSTTTLNFQYRLTYL